MLKWIKSTKRDFIEDGLFGLETASGDVFLFTFYTVSRWRWEWSYVCNYIINLGFKHNKIITITTPTLQINTYTNVKNNDE